MTSNKQTDYDAIVIGAGFSGLYMLHRLRNLGLSTQVYESGDGVGGTWYWNRYPGARCDMESIYYNYTFSEDIYKEWTWTSKFPEQTEILSYLNFVADKLNLRSDIQFNTWVSAAHYDEENNIWEIHLDDGSYITAKYFITGVGCLSSPNLPDFKGLDRFEGERYHTGRWPHEEVSFKGKHVGVIGTGSSGIQAIPEIAKEADHLTVFQRTPQYTVPARDHLYDEKYIQEAKDNYEEIKERLRTSVFGLGETPQGSALEDTEEERINVYENAWEEGGFALFLSYNDLFISEEASDTVSNFVRSKISEVVKDPDVANKLIPTSRYATKRPVLDTNYYETYNRDNVSLIDVKKSPIKEITSNGLATEDSHYELDALVFATGYDGMTGPLLNFDIRGRGGISLKEKWSDGADVETYLGLATSKFPNMFTITGPESPSVLSNMPISIEHHVEWISDCLQYLQENEIDTIEADVDAEKAWSAHSSEVGDMTLVPEEASWYTGANIPGKPRAFLVYLGGVNSYHEKISEVARNGYEGFHLYPTKETSSKLY